MTGGSSGSFQNGKIYEDNPSCNAHLLFNSVILSAAKDPGNGGAITEASRHSLDVPGPTMKEHIDFVYLVSSNSGILYIGMTTGICRRALQHNA